ncbi:MAG: transposase, partial [Planctomycetes bacterium]|nr:transposase [Planctomycetota bacterium]
GLESKIKYVRLTRRIEHVKERYYAQLVCEGKPFRKVKNRPGKGIVGLDLGPSTIAVVSDTEARLLRFCDEIEPYHEEIRRLQRGMSRCQRASNPQNFFPDVVTRIPRKGKKPRKVTKKGVIRKGPKQWKDSAEYRRLKRRLSEKRRREAQYRKCLQNRLVNEIYRMGDTVKTEKLSYKSFQMMFGKSVGFRAPGMFMQRLRDKAKALDLPKPDEFSTRTTKLSQTCHGCGRILKKTLSQRWHECECGVSAQRDLYSAFLARCVEDDKLHVDQARKAWPGVCALLQAAWEQAKSANGSTRKMPASFGLRKRRSQSGSSVETGRNFTKTPDVVVLPLGEGESRVEVSGTPGVRQFEGATRPPPCR